MTMTDLLACPPALHNRIRAEHSVVRDITHAALAKGAIIRIADEEGGYERKNDWYDLKVAMHDTDEQTLFLLFPRDAFGPDTQSARLYLYLVYGNSGPDVVSDWSIRTDDPALSETIDAWFEPIWDKAVEDAGRKFGIEV
jgi:hypothetical protein